MITERRKYSGAHLSSIPVLKKNSENVKKKKYNPIDFLF